MSEPILENREALGVDQLLLLIVSRITQMMQVDRCTLFLYDAARDELWSKVMRDDALSEIRIPAGQGIAGSAFKQRKTINLPDVYEDPRFDSSWDKRTGFRTKSMLCVPLIDNKGHCIGAVQVLNKSGGGPFTAQDEMLLEAFSSQAAVTLENAIILEELQVRRQELAENHNKLQSAFRDNEAQKTSLEAAIRKIRVIRTISIGFVAVLFVGLGVYLWTQDIGGNRRAAASRAATAAPAAGAVPTVRVQPQTVSSTLSLSGTLEPYAVVNVVAPFNGRVKEKLFEYGQSVKKDQVLLVLDATEAESQLRQAETTYAKARDDAANLENWDKSNEVSDARRNLTKARNNAKALEQRAADTKKLFDRGIVSASEYQNLVEQLSTQKLDLETMDGQFQVLMRRGSAENVRLAQLDLKVATQRVEDLRLMVSQARLTSPVDGVVLLPTEPLTSKEGQRAERGAQTTQSGLLVTIGDLRGFSARVKVDEVNVGKLKVGQAVAVTGTAFPGIELNGRLSYISSQAKGGGFDGVPSFSADVQIETIPDEQRGKVLLGMSADLLVKIYEKPDALLVPIAAVEVFGDERAVYVAKPGAKPERVQVTTGVTTLDSVEILTGVKAGDEIYAMPPPRS